MMYDGTLWAEIIEPMLPRFKKLWALRFVVSQMWNKESSFVLANTWEYADEKAFFTSKELFDEVEAELAKRSEISLIITASALRSNGIMNIE